MVFFTCDGCGESIKKPSVPKHRNQCRRSFKVSCMDCSKEFYGEDYNSHIKCITESQKYAGAGPGLNKNEKKQEEWVGLVQNAIRNACGINPEVKQLLEYVSQFDNIPRKQTKFLNFLKNSQRKTYNERTAKMAWNLISKELEKLRTPQQEPEKEKAEENVEDDRIEETTELKERKSKKEKKKDHKHEEVLDTNREPERAMKQKGRKRKQLEDEETVGNVFCDGATKEKKQKKEKENEYPDIEPNSNGIDEEVPENANVQRKFKWSEFAYKILESREDNQLSLKKLKKKLIAEYICINGEIGDVEALWAKGLKKISKASQFKIKKDNITLL